MQKTLLSLIIFAIWSVSLWGQETGKKQSSAIFISTEPVIDGILNEPEWQGEDWEGGFVQFEPYNGKAPGQETWFKVLYSNNSLFVGIRACDEYPDSISYRLTRRDIMDGDFVAVTLDTYHDMRTAYSFYINAAGIKSDEYYYDNGLASDISWDPVWYGKTSSDEKGWYAEFKIPLSQLRFKNDSAMVWGLSVLRKIFRYSETDLWVPLGKDTPGWIHLMGELNDICATPRKQFDITPYVNSTIIPDEDKRFSTSFGIDGKAGLTNNLILDYTLNPDFGQVESDPSEVNLTVFETFFEEKRPFFIEGSNITSFSVDVVDEPGTDNLFYSRRIGRTPRNIPDINPGESYSMPGFSSILGAGKVSGKNSNGLAVGFIEAITAHEFAEIDDGEETRYETAEPLTSYFVGRVTKDFREGQTVIGGIFTATTRTIENDSTIFWMPQAAYTGGVDLIHSFENRNYKLEVNLSFSYVSGKEESITALQRSPSRYFQRPFQDYLVLDSTKTSLSGTGGKILFSKEGDGHFMYLVGLKWNSPGFELNDVGYMRSANEITQVSWLGYHMWEPIGIYKDISIDLTQWTSWDFGGVNTVSGFNLSVMQIFKNNWSLLSLVSCNFNIKNPQMLRGGPSYRLPSKDTETLILGTDRRRKFRSTLTLASNHGRYGSRNGYSVSPGFSYKPNQRLNVSFNPEYTLFSNEQQYITTALSGEDFKYVLGRIDQQTISASFRINYTIRPDITLEYWGQPFISTGKFSAFKDVIDPLAKNYYERFHEFSTGQITEQGNIYSIDEEIDGIEDYSFRNPDFTVREFLSNLVLRWEFKPGSTAFLVWNQTRADYLIDDGSGVASEIRNLLGTPPQNAFLLKLSYRFGR